MTHSGDISRKRVNKTVYDFFPSLVLFYILNNNINRKRNKKEYKITQYGKDKEKHTHAYISFYSHSAYRSNKISHSRTRFYKFPFSLCFDFSSSFFINTPMRNQRTVSTRTQNMKQRRHKSNNYSKQCMYVGGLFIGNTNLKLKIKTSSHENQIQLRRFLTRDCSTFFLSIIKNLPRVCVCVYKVEKQKLKNKKKVLRSCFLPLLTQMNWVRQKSLTVY